MQHSILWFVDFDPEQKMCHGGSLRWFNLSREIIQQTHQVFFAINKNVDDLDKKIDFLEELKLSGLISGFFLIDYQLPEKALFLKRITFRHPSVINQIYKNEQVRISKEVKHIIDNQQITSLVISDRNAFFLLKMLKGQIPLLVDWVDSYTLYFTRSIRAKIQQKTLSSLLSDIKNIIAVWEEERYYGQIADVNLFASPIDTNHFKSLHEKTTCFPLLNGIDLPATIPNVDKIPNRLIFTGTMNWPPNYEAALWFIRYVMPHILEQRPDIQFIVAGRNPVKELLSHHNTNIIIKGAVEDMSNEIAKSALYVAPLITGGGFKNKILEAIINNTFIIASNKAVEFLPKHFYEQMVITDDPQQMAKAILLYLKSPATYVDRLEKLFSMTRTEFTWQYHANNLLSYINSVVTN